LSKISWFKKANSKCVANLACVYNAKALKVLKSKCSKAKSLKLILKVKLLKSLIKGCGKRFKRLIALSYLESLAKHY
jgi:hypothetical protein